MCGANRTRACACRSSHPSTRTPFCPFAVALRAQPDRERGCRTWTSGATEKSEAFINDRRINLNRYLCELARSSDAARFPYFLIFAGGKRQPATLIVTSCAIYDGARLAVLEGRRVYDAPCGPDATDEGLYKEEESL